MKNRILIASTLALLISGCSAGADRYRARRHAVFRPRS